MSTKHTPGPWKYREISPFDDGLGYISADEHDIMHAGVSDLPAEENRANANLIAAAPEMFEALEAILNQADELDELSIPALAMGRAVLAKARGETP